MFLALLVKHSTKCKCSRLISHLRASASSFPTNKSSLFNGPSFTLSLTLSVFKPARSLHAGSILKRGATLAVIQGLLKHGIIAQTSVWFAIAKTWAVDLQWHMMHFELQQFERNGSINIGLMRGKYYNIKQDIENNTIELCWHDLCKVGLFDVSSWHEWEPVDVNTWISNGLRCWRLARLEHVELRIWYWHKLRIDW